MNNVLDWDTESGTLETGVGTYFIVSDGSNADVHYWNGDTTGNGYVDEGELTLFAHLEGITPDNIGDLAGDNFEIIPGPT
ncbi:MAG: hypothetical protein KKC20_17195 [Proteobacteria bacterium]|nr:hypothetical protein [Pseudomonadota bacterium]